ncbi:MAG: HipA family kinase [Pyrinomonadaceae bacterium]
MRNVNVTRYVTPLREGGSLPAIVEADDDGMYVLKFRGAGQGPKALVAELIAGEIARACGLRVPEIVFAELDIELSRTEPDPEIQDLLKASAGLNLALDYLPGSITFDPVVDEVGAGLASEIVWLDAFVTNVDRTARNPNMLMWHKELWLIDHGASLYFHHSWRDWEEQSGRPFVQIKDHILLPRASSLAEADVKFRGLLGRDLFEDVVENIPDLWIEQDGESPDEKRAVYVEFLLNRFEASNTFVEEAERARESVV